MQQINIHTAKTHLSTLVEKTAAGEPLTLIAWALKKSQSCLRADR